MCLLSLALTVKRCHSFETRQHTTRKMYDKATYWVQKQPMLNSNATAAVSRKNLTTPKSQSNKFSERHLKIKQLDDVPVKAGESTEEAYSRSSSPFSADLLPRSQSASVTGSIQSNNTSSSSRMVKRTRTYVQQRKMQGKPVFRRSHIASVSDARTSVSLTVVLAFLTSVQNVVSLTLLLCVE